MANCEYCNLPYKRLITFTAGEYEDGTPLEIYVEIDGQRIRAYDNDYASSNIESIKINYPIKTQTTNALKSV